jgi:cytochrome c biogenesis protein CcdA
MAWFVVSAAVVFAAAGVLAVTTPSSWPLLLARVVLIALGIVLLIVGWRRRQRTPGVVQALRSGSGNVGLGCASVLLARPSRAVRLCAVLTYQERTRARVADIA